MMIPTSTRFQMGMAFLVGVASFRFRQMVEADYVSKGGYFQRSEFLFNALLGVSWMHLNLISVAIYSTLLAIFVNATTIYISWRDIENVAYYGTFRPKYFLENPQKWSGDRLVQAESCLEILLGMAVIRALEIIEREFVQLALDAENENQEDEQQPDGLERYEEVEEEEEDEGGSHQ